MYLRVAAAIVEIAQHQVLGCSERLRALHVRAAPARHLERAVAPVARDAVGEREADILRTEFMIAVKKNDKEALKQPRFGALWRKYKLHRFLEDKLPWLLRLKHRIVRD